MPTRIVEVRKNILRENDVVARRLRERLVERGTFAVSLVSSPGAGKTTLLQRTLSELRRTQRVAALVGDLATDADAKRLAESGAPVRQITTGTVCHLDAMMVETALAEWDVDTVDFLFIENVGNLVCPASYDLGEAMRVVLMSVTEGEDKPLKYPTIFATADIAVITKTDLAGPARFDREAAYANLRSARPELAILEVAALTGAGMSSWLSRLTETRRESLSRA